MHQFEFIYWHKIAKDQYFAFGMACNIKLVLPINGFCNKIAFLDIVMFKKNKKLFKALIL